MTLKLYNTLTRKKEDFVPINDKKVGMYSCGPTVYHYAHIGNLRTYVFNDILRRTLKYLGYELNHVMNITDVGHLTSDSDTGEDKMLKGAKREKKTVWDVADFYTNAFMKDIERLNIETPEVVPRATDNIKEMQEIISKIEENGYSYESGGNVYFDTSKFKKYVELGKLKLDKLEEGSRVEADKNKKNHSDFVLWFTKSKFDDQEMKWDSKWGTGYPGWHIECSAMSSRYLGEQFDIHTGGIDHIPVHHTNEIAQSEAAFGKHPWVKYWMHGEFLVINKAKMAKSGDNFLTLQVLVEKGFDPIIYRFFCLGAHYRQQLNFSFDSMESAKNSYENLRNRIIEIKNNLDDKQESDIKIKAESEAKFIDCINDDLNMPKALAVMQSVLREKELSNKDKLELLLDFDKVLGLKFSEMKEEKLDIPQDVQKLIDKRQKARENKDWKASDELRDEIKKKGYEVIDSKEGIKIKKIII